MSISSAAAGKKKGRMFREPETKILGDPTEFMAGAPAPPEPVPAGIAATVAAVEAGNLADGIEIPRPQRPNLAAAVKPADNAELDVRMVPIDRLVPTKENPRVLRDDEAMATLIASVKAVGVLEPVLAREHPRKPGYLDLRAGERRYRAALAAGHEHIPCRILILDDAAAAMLTVCENMARKNLRPIEEARGIQTMLEHGLDEERIAAELGRSPSWVARRARLTKLIDHFKNAALDRQHPIFEVAADLLESLAKLPPEIQEQIWKLTVAAKPNLPWPLRDRPTFDHYVNDNFLRVLDRAPFERDDILVFPEAGSCTNCMKRTGRHQLLFAEDEDEQGRLRGERCLDLKCWGEKCRRVLTATAKAMAQETGANPILLDTSVNAYAQVSPEIQKAYGHTVQTLGRWEETSKSDPKAVRALIINGAGQGQKKWVRKRPETKSPRSRTTVAEKSKKTVKTLDQLMSELTYRRTAWKVDQVQVHIHKLAINKAPLPAGRNAGEVLELAFAFGTTHCAENIDTNFVTDPWRILKGFRAKQTNTAELVDRNYRRVFEVWESRLVRYGNAPDIGKYWTEVERMNAVLKLDLAKLDRDATEKFPVPKEWARLNADGTPKGMTSGKSAKGGKP